MNILIHSSKTMRPPLLDDGQSKLLPQPELMDKVEELANYLRTLSSTQLASIMRISDKLAASTYKLLGKWTTASSRQRPAIDSFLGDIYSGLQVPSWTAQDRVYADQTLRILSGLYGVVRPGDGIYPYRLEMGYRLPKSRFANLPSYWGDSIARTLPNIGPIINLAALEYSKVVTDYLPAERVVTPAFLTIRPKTGQPVFVVVHAKIARGAFAYWMIRNRITTVDRVKDFDDLGYQYSQRLSSADRPVFICQKFAGLGLSVRLTAAS